MPNRSALLTRWLPLLVWMCLIFTGSSDLLAGEHTSRFFVPLMHALFGHHLSEDQIGYVHHLFRKCGHLSEYTVLCVLFWRAFVSLRVAYIPVSSGQERRDYLLSVLCSALYAATDEFHQSFVPSRTATVSDVLIDTCGAALGLACCLLLVALYQRRVRPLALRLARR